MTFRTDLVWTSVAFAAALFITNQLRHESGRGMVHGYK